MACCRHTEKEEQLCANWLPLSIAPTSKEGLVLPGADEPDEKVRGMGFKMDQGLGAKLSSSGEVGATPEASKGQSVRRAFRKQRSSLRQDASCCEGTLFQQCHARRHLLVRSTIGVGGPYREEGGSTPAQHLSEDLSICKANGHAMDHMDKSEGIIGTKPYQEALFKDHH